MSGEQMMTSEHDTGISYASGPLLPLEADSLAALSEVALPVSVRIGRVSLTVGELLGLSQDAVITLEQRLDDPVEVLVGDRVVALGELVSVNDEMGVRITQIAASSGGEQ